jgi:heme exporter protein C
MVNAKQIDRALLGTALVLSALGLYYGLVLAPKERAMGDVYRILFVHVPAAWLTLVAFLVTFGSSVAYLYSGDWRADALAVASTEVGVVLNLILLVTGSIWGRPTWGVYWTWDPRLTTAAILGCSFAGYLALRTLAPPGERRAIFSALVAILASAGLPFVWFAVQFWSTLHQVQSSPATMHPAMVLALRLNAFAFLAIYLCLCRWRYLIERHSQQTDAPPPLAAEAGR